MPNGPVLRAERKSARRRPCQPQLAVLHLLKKKKKKLAVLQSDADVVSQRTSKSGPPMVMAPQRAPAAAGTPGRQPSEIQAPFARSPPQAPPPLLPPHSRGSTCSSTARPQPHHHGGRAAAEVGRRLRRRLRRPAAALVGERAPLAPRLAGQLVVRVRDEGAERGIGHARVRGPGELRPKEASRGGVLQGHIPRERGSVAQAGRRRGLGGCVRRAGFACLHGPVAIEVLLFV